MTGISAELGLGLLYAPVFFLEAFTAGYAVLASIATALFVVSSKRPRRSVIKFAFVCAAVTVIYVGGFKSLPTSLVLILPLIIAQAVMTTCFVLLYRLCEKLIDYIDRLLESKIAKN